MHILRRRLDMAATGIDVAALAISYTGVYQDYGVVQMNDGDYRLLAFTSSGTLTIDKPVNCEVCVVGGGANGAKATQSQGGDGGTNGGNAAYYGSGAGGGRYFEENGVERLYDGGSGYRGIVYMRIPVNQ